jgi:hypothetical protein
MASWGNRCFCVEVKLLESNAFESLRGHGKCGFLSVGLCRFSVSGPEFSWCSKSLNATLMFFSVGFLRYLRCLSPICEFNQSTIFRIDWYLEI